jgi:predicted CXXCH cytochrome family protein
MDRTERFYRIVALLKQRKSVTLEPFLAVLSISPATFKRDLEGVVLQAPFREAPSPPPRPVPPRNPGRGALGPPDSTQCHTSHTADSEPRLQFIARQRVEPICRECHATLGNET